MVKDGKAVPNPYTKWSEIRADLPDQDILAFIPGTKHGTREVFEEKVIAAGCKEAGAAEVFASEKGDEAKAKEACMALRTDGKSVDIDGDYTETLPASSWRRTASASLACRFTKTTPTS